jgi:hypothetical protein
MNASDSSQHHLDVKLEKVTWYKWHILLINALNFLGLHVGLWSRGGRMVEWTYIRLFNYTASEVLWFSLGSITLCNICRLDAVKIAVGYLLSNQMNCVSHSKNVKDCRGRSRSIQAEIWTGHLAYTHSPCFMPFYFNAPCHYTWLLDLCPLIFGIMPLGWPCSIMRTPSYSIISYGNNIFYLRPLFQEHT